jgi:hypothetical protein
MTRTLRRFVVLLAVLALSVACGSSKDGTSGDGSGTPQPPAASGDGGGASETTGSGGAGGGGVANNSFTYEITGDYTASGEQPFVPEASTFVQGGWVAIFGTGDQVVQITSIPGSETVTYGDPQIAVSATRVEGCTIDLTQNDSDGLVGTFECHGVGTAFSQTGQPATVDFIGQFDAHP